MLRDEASARPRQRCKGQQNYSSDSNPARVRWIERRRPDEHDEPDRAEHHSRNHAKCRLGSTWPGPLEQHNPDWERRDEQRRKSGRNEALGENDAAVSAHEKKSADNPRIPPLNASGRCAFASPRPDVEEQPGDGEPDRRHEQRGNRFDREEDREVRGSPYDVDRSERRDELPARNSHESVCADERLGVERRRESHAVI